MKMETVVEDGEEEYMMNEDDTDWNNHELDLSQLCRICANPNEYLIPIFEGEGVEHELMSKISKHLPIKVTESDKLPTQLCYQCASTLIAWHDMVVGCLEADEKLRTLLGNDDQDTEGKDKSTTDGKSELLTSGVMKKTEMKANAVLPTVETEINHEIHQPELSLPNEIERVIVEEEVTSMEPELVEEVIESKCLEPFRAYHQTQTAMRMQQWVTDGPVFCMFCGQMKEGQSMLMKHLSTEHKIQCGHCRTHFPCEQQLAGHMVLHGGKQGSDTENKKIEYSCKGTKSTTNLKFGDSDKALRNTQLKLHCEKQHVERRVRNTLSRRKGQEKILFRCDKCPSLFSRRVYLKRHTNKHLPAETLDLANGSNSNKFSDKNNLTKILDKASHDDMDGKSRSDIEDDMNLMNYSDDSVKSEDISRHLDIKHPFAAQPMSELVSCGQIYSCSMCDFTCTRKQEITAHRRKEHATHQGSAFNEQENVSIGLFPCSLCGNSYSRNSDLQRHIVKKHGGEKFSRRCIDSVDDMDVEIINKAKQVINGITVYRCEMCNKCMSTKRGYVWHIRAHTGERPFTCHVCGKQYRSNTDLSRHLKCVHDGLKNYPCDVCGRCFANKGTRNDHRRTHTGEKPFVCHICGKSFPTPNSIYLHRRTHTDVFPHGCTSCDKKFRRKQQLIHHVRTHTGEKPHACDICGKYFRVKDEVARHKLTHSNEKPHVCPICGICFAQKRYLSNHTKTHHSRLI